MRVGLFKATMEVQKGPFLSKTYHTYHTIMKLVTVIPYLRKMQKNTN